MPDDRSNSTIQSGPQPCGWCFPFPQEDQPFVNCVAGLETPLETGEDGKATLEIIFAA